MVLMINVNDFSKKKKKKSVIAAETEIKRFSLILLQQLINRKYLKQKLFKHGKTCTCYSFVYRPSTHRSTPLF